MIDSGYVHLQQYWILWLFGINLSALFAANVYGLEWSSVLSGS